MAAYWGLWPIDDRYSLIELHFGLNTIPVGNSFLTKFISVCDENTFFTLKEFTLLVTEENVSIIDLWVSNLLR